MLYIFQNPQDKNVLLTHHNNIKSQKQNVKQTIHKGHMLRFNSYLTESTGV
jgi:hypothetical protein